MRILYVRHGKSIANATGMIGTPDTPLAEEGIEQARQTGQNLRRENVTQILCSPFIRTQQTAEIIAGELGLPLSDTRVIPDLHERRLGDLEGEPKRHESAYYYENDTEHGFESQRELISRMLSALEQVKDIARSTTGTTVVVGHATAGFYFLQVAKGKKHYEEFDHFNQMDNAAYVEVNIASLI